jgi:hypothetical protein
MPSTGGYWIGAFIGVIGLALVGALIAITVVRMHEHIDAFARTPIPGTMMVHLDASTGQTIYVEGSAPVPLQALHLRVTDPKGNEILVRAYSLDVRYDVPGSPGTLGYAVGTFRSTAAGPYRVVSDATVVPPGVALAVGDSFPSSIIGYALGAFIVLLLTFAGALTLVIVTGVRRSRARRAW